MNPTRPTRRRLNAEINVVPYIDVMLVLLIIFMVTAPLLTQGIDVQLPAAASAPVPLSEEPVTFSVNRKGQYFLDIGSNTSKPIGAEELSHRVAIAIKTNPQLTVLVRADSRVDYGQVAKGMTLLQAAGVNHLAFVTTPPEGER